MQWLQEHIWPLEQKWVGEAFVRDGTDLGIAEMIRSGTTCFNDMYFFPEITAHQAIHHGIRACTGLILIDFPTVWAENAEQYIDSFDRKTREEFSLLKKRIHNKTENIFSKAKSDVIEIDTSASISDTLLKYFKFRERRLR